MKPGAIYPVISLRKFLIILSILIMSIILLFTSIVLNLDIAGRIEQQTEEMGKIRFRQYIQYVEKNFEELDKLISYMQKDSSLQEILLADSNNIMSRIYRKTQVEAYLAKLALQYDAINSINIVSSDREHFYYGNLVFSEDLVDSIGIGNTLSPVYSVADSSKIAKVISTQLPETIESLENNIYLHFTIQGVGMKYWDAWIILNQKLFFRDREDIASTAYLKDGTLFYSGGRFREIESHLTETTYFSEQRAAEQMFNNTILYSQTIAAGQNITGFYAIDIKEYMDKIHFLRRYAYLIYLSSLMVSFAVSGFFSGRIIRPVNELSLAMNAYKLEGIPADIGIGKSRKNFSMREKIFYYLLVTILIPVAFYMVVFSYQSDRMMHEMKMNAFGSVFTKTARQLDRIMGNKISLLQKIVLDDRVQDYFMDQSRRLAEDVENAVENLRYLGLNRDSVTLYDHNGNVVFCDRYEGADKDATTVLQNNSTVTLGVSYNAIKDKIGDKYLSLFMPVIYLGEGEYKSKRVGVCRIDTEFYRIENELAAIRSAGGDAGIINDRGSLIFDDGKIVFEEPVKLEEKEKIIEVNGVNGRHRVYCSNIPGTVWYTAAWLDMDGALDQSRSMKINDVFLFIVITLITLILSHFISMNLLKPIMKLNQVFKLYDVYGNYLKDDHYFEENYFIDEINSMGESFITMVDRIETLVDDLIIANNEKSKLEIAKKSAEMAALQAQINPHFLYNTLTNVIALVRTGSLDEAILTVKLLSTLFKYGISREEIIIPLSEEIAYARAYTQIMEIRHKDRISFQWDIDDKALNYLTIKLILQPLIENSIRHGFGGSNNKGTVFIRCRADSGSIVFEVEDNGKGISPDELKSLEKALQSGKYGTKIGVFNVQSRLRIHYGSEYGLRIYSTYGKGTLVTVNIPQSRRTDMPE